MSLATLPELRTFLSTYFSETDPEKDAETIAGFLAQAQSSRVQAITEQGKRFLAGSELSLEELGTETNRWFGDEDEARAWIAGLLAGLDGPASAGQGGEAVKDCNGAVLSEGDSVQVIKDLKVKGGSNDLKRGTLIKKIHLTGDTEAVECRVDGSTLVLKTCFLKKA